MSLSPSALSASSPASVKVSVPATTANLGPGFDCLGAAWSLHNHFRFTLLGKEALNQGERLQIVAQGDGAEQLSTDATNFVYQSFCQLFAEIHQPVPPVRIDIDSRIPLSRGLGSSATAIVGGLVGANMLAGEPLDGGAIAALATKLEGHPDNVVPALLGGCRLAAQDLNQAWEICELPWHSDIIPVLAIPDFTLSTEAARQVLPQTYSRADAIFNAAHLGLLIRGLTTGHAPWLRAALQDKIHQPYRKSLIPGFDAVQAAALATGAHGLVISGAGPTVLALAAPETVAQLSQALAAAWQSHGITAQVQALALNAQGTVVCRA